jgi:hypothetical protein
VNDAREWLDASSFAAAEDVARRIEGWLLPSEIRFLLVVAAQPTARGAVVELGSYHGKSTAVLALGTRLTDRPGLVSVDPFDPPERDRNLRREQVASLVDFRAQRSGDFWRNWQGQIRLLWHDGANDRATVAEDVRLALPHLADGAIVAFHDVRNPSGERLHVFSDRVLASPHFGPSGVCGTIGWSRYCANVDAARPYRAANDRLRRQLTRLGPYHDLRRRAPMSRLEKMGYKVLRWFVPHGEMTAQRWRHVSRRNDARRATPAA